MFYHAEWGPRVDEEGIRAVSKALFGNLYFLEVSRAIALDDKGRFTQQLLSNRLGLDKGLVATVLRRLKAGGFIRPVHESGKERPFERLDSSFWLHSVGLHDELRSD